MSFDKNIAADDLLFLIDNDEDRPLRELLARGLDPDRRLGGGLSFLMVTVAVGFVNVSRAFIDGGADVNKRDDKGLTPLMHAARRCETLDCLQLLIEKEAQLDAQDDDGRTALMHAAANAAPEQAVRAVPFLLAQGADVTLTDKDGRTALDLARDNGQPLVIAALEEAAGIRAVAQQAAEARADLVARQAQLRASAPKLKL